MYKHHHEFKKGRRQVNEKIIELQSGDIKGDNIGIEYTHGVVG